MTIYTHHATPVGDLLLVGEPGLDGGATVTGIYFEGHRRGRPVDLSWEGAAGAFEAVEAQLDAYFAGQRTTFDLPVRFDHGSPFQRRVWEELTRIPAGATVSYGELAVRCGVSGAARAVGSAVARNPISIVVPCHRVVGSDGSVTGYAGGVERKRALLALEARIATGAQ